MTIEQAQAMKDSGRYGMQGGLLSASEMVELYRFIKGTVYYPNTPEQGRASGRALFPVNTLSILEVGHYMGLSTAVMAKAVNDNSELYRDDYRIIVSIDAHIPDAWVKDSNEETYMSNMKDDHVHGTVQSLTMDSRAIRTIAGFDAVFYDGDHADEQWRFTQVVHQSPNVTLFIFDDRDFPVPAKCCEFLRANGWTDRSPELKRLNGDKTNPQTMTLGVFTR